MYFNKLPKILYPSGKSKMFLTDITKNVRIVRQVIKDIKLLTSYTIKEGESIEQIAEQIYGDPELHWVVMLANDKYDYINDYPRTQLQLDEYVERTYGNQADSITTHVKNGYIVDSDTVGAAQYSNRDLENLLNEQKRFIKIIPSAYITQLVSEYNAA